MGNSEIDMLRATIASRTWVSSRVYAGRTCASPATKMASSVRQMLEDAPHDAASLQALVRRGVHQGQSTEAGGDGADELVLSDDARQTLASIEALDER